MIKKQNHREFDELRVLPDGKWQNAVDFYGKQQIKMGVKPENFESITFSDCDNRNIHLKSNGKSLCSGANLPENNKLLLRIGEDISEKVEHIFSGENPLIISCAGIRSLIDVPVYTGRNSIAGLLFGGIVMAKDKPKPGSLMISKLTVKSKINK